VLSIKALALPAFRIVKFESISPTFSQSSFNEILRFAITKTQFPIKSWYEYFAEQTLTDAIMDTLTAFAHKIELKGESLRNKK